MRNSIIIKIFVSFLLVSLIPIGGLIAYNDWANRRIVYNMKIEQLKYQATKTAKSIDRDISSKKERILYLSKCCCLSECAEIHTIEAIPAEIKTRLNEFLKCISALESVFILNTKGEVVIKNIGNLPAGNYASHNYFVEAMKGVTFFSEPKMEQGKGYVYCSTAIRGCNKEILGVLVMRYPAEVLWSLVEEEKSIHDKGGVCILSDRFGVRIGHASNRSLIFKSWIPLNPYIKNKQEKERYYGKDIKIIGFTSIPEVSKALASFKDLYFIHPLVISTEKYHGYCIPLKENKWIILYAVPSSAFLAQVKHLTQNASFSTGIVFIVIIAVTWLVSTKLLRPIKKLTYAANEIANGNLNYPITDGSGDEIGRLMESFEVMRHKLKESNEELKEVNREAILMLARACEVRDEDTGGHILRIQHYSTLLAKELNLEESFIREIGPASMLHDVGKIHMPDTVLLRKAGGLTHEEREEMKKHPGYGEHILGKKRFFQMAEEVVRWHHENWDGTGYPDGLKGESIPISARIVRLADVYDALVTKRSYKKEWPDTAAYEEIVRYSGIFFDPQVVQAFKQIFEREMIQKVRNIYT